MAEGGALLRRYGGECLHRGFESLLLRFWTIVVSIRLRLSGAATDRTRAPFMLLGRRRDRTQHARPDTTLALNEGDLGFSLAGRQALYGRPATQKGAYNGCGLVGAREVEGRLVIELGEA